LNINLGKYFMRVAAIFFLLTFGFTTPSYAEKLSTSLYLSPSLYQQHGHLFGIYQEYWFNQASLFAPIAMQALQEKTPEIAMCQSGASSSRVIKLIPDVFFNPQMRVLHGKVIANVYSGGGTLLGTYVGKSQKPATIDVAVEANIQKVYAAAMSDLIKHLNLSPKADEVASELQLPCNVVGAQQEPKNGIY
jgi:hypothetical protein